MDNKQIADNYLKWFSTNYTYLKNKYYNLCKEKDWTFDEDIFSETYLRVYDIICKKGIKDSSDRGFECYTFKSFQNNIRNEGNYSRIKKRDFNINSDNINDVYEQYYNSNNVDSKTKITNDLWKDFATLYIMMRVEQQFDQEHFYLYRLKTLGNLTFKQLAEKTNIKASRLKVIEVSHWVKENITKEEIKQVFNELYGDII